MFWCNLFLRTFGFQRASGQKLPVLQGEPRAKHWQAQIEACAQFLCLSRACGTGRDRMQFSWSVEGVSQRVCPSTVYYSEGRCNILGAEVSKVILTDFILFSRACFQPVFCKCMFFERPSCEVKIKHLGPPGPTARTRGEPNTLGVAVMPIFRYQIAHLLEN